MRIRAEIGARIINEVLRFFRYCGRIVQLNHGSIMTKKSKNTPEPEGSRLPEAAKQQAQEAVKSLDINDPERVALRAKQQDNALGFLQGPGDDTKAKDRPGAERKHIPNPRNRGGGRTH